MKAKRTTRRSATRWLATCAALPLLTLLAAATATETASTPEPTPVPAAAPEVAGTPAGAAGMTIYVDPVTGRLRPEPAPGTETLRLDTMADPLAHSTEGLVEVQSRSRRDGVTMHLQGRFRSVAMAEVNTEGKVVTNCDLAENLAAEAQHQHPPVQVEEVP